ncbi:MAG: DEAD/DEAH box helicase [Phycisphaerales bacterium]
MNTQSNDSDPSTGPELTQPEAATQPDAPAGPLPKGADDIFADDQSFASLGLRNSVLKGIDELGFKTPTKIQSQLIPLIVAGKDVLGQAKTGTGKTAAFGLPLLHGAERGKEFQSLILVPTRELAIQVATDMNNFAKYTPIRTSAVFGGERVHVQVKALERGPEIIVATPGRIMDMVERGHIHHRHVKYIVLDEVDRMLDIGFRDDIRRILKGCPPPAGFDEQGQRLPGRQTIFVSATLSPEIEQLARSYANNAEKIVATSGSLTVSRVKQFYLTVQPWDKKSLLYHLLTHEEPALTIVFCRMKKTVDVLNEYLNKKGIESHAIHGDMYQSKRNKVIDKLRKGNLSVLIASDLASRGLDVEGITHVINYDLPEDPDLYIHRIGRTARAGREGVAWALVTPEQGDLLTQIEHLINTEIPKLDYPDFKPGPVPKEVVASRELDAKRAAVAQNFNRFADPAQKKLEAAAKSSAAIDPNKFPGGIVPTKLPPKRMQGKVKTARGMKAEIAQTLLGERPPPPAE